MPFQVLTTTAASITELKRDPMGTFNAGEGAPVAILNRNEPAFYCVPPALYAQFMEMLEDEELGRIVDERAGEPVIEVNIDDLQAGI
ncbi:type II toxin-antitoxin system Phd/YefM family antitoxin [Serratia sp. DD3]|uniref:type II toxin-antitoxin system Phd/YefM family antitoxin n=1 Tax=Serratia sp. DD3 TaxID=1410619 RepID=UPI0003C4F0BE|nr:type II toxin-antitoxin system Phd/YefM family antitoxin [Serratia sp. DD3]KEY60437.1 putative antitoxin of the YafO-YafN toxin-antitoxin system [Serratia sp. DD3]